MSSQDLNIGDRVVCVKGDERLIAGYTGTVVDVERFSSDTLLYKICWDNYVNGHSCGGLCPYGYGWNVRRDRIEPEYTGFDIATAADFMDLLLK